MFSSFFRSFLFAGVLIILSCNQSRSVVDTQDGLATFDKDSLIHHILILASDSFQGRRPFTPGEERTVDYLKSSFARLGLEPGNGDSYVQDVPLVEITPDSISPITIQSAKGNFELQKMKDFVVWTKRTDTIVSLNNDEVVFAGFGIVAPEYN